MNQKLLLTLAVLLPAVPVLAELNVVATITDFGAIAKEIGQDKVRVSSIAKGTEDSHFVDARPSFIRVLNQADVLIEGGADLESGWLPALVSGARNRKIVGDSPGHVILARYVRLLETPAGPVDRSMGDIHPAGNPHFWLDPENVAIIARVISETLSRLDPGNSEHYKNNLDRFTLRLNRKLAEWTAALAPFRGAKVVSYHKSFNYFLNRFGLELTGTIESRPGIEPTAAYVNGLIQRLQNQGVKLVMVEPYRPRKTPEYLAQSLDAKLLVLPEKVEGKPNITTSIELFDYLAAQITGALRELR